MKVKVIVEIDGKRFKHEIRPKTDTDKELLSELYSNGNPARWLVNLAWLEIGLARERPEFI